MWVVHVQDVRIRGVADLPATETAHADDEHVGPELAPAGGLDLADHDLERGLDGRLADLGQGLAHLLQRDLVLQVRHRDAEDLSPADRSDRGHCGVRVLAATGRGAHPTQQVLPSARAQPISVAEHLNGFWAGEQQCTGESARAEGVRKRLRGLLRPATI